MHIFKHWCEKLHYDGVFDDEEYSKNFNGDDCIVSEDNALEILEALEISEITNEEEIIDLIEKLTKNKDEAEITYAEFKYHLYDFLTN